MQLKRLLKIPTKQHCFIFGPRQVGKSSLLRTLFPENKVLYYNLLKPDSYFRLSENPAVFLEDIKSRPKQITHVIVDEVQKLPELLDSVHYAIEELNDAPYFILTGSSARKLKRNHANMLGGRAQNLSMFPLVRAEFTEDFAERFSLQRSLELGSLPKPYLDCSKEEAVQLLISYVDTYLKEEIQQEALVRNVPSFHKFLRFAAEENTNQLNFANISKNIGVSAATIREYYQILEDTLVGFRLEAYSKSIRQSIVRSPKFYFFDVGVVRALTRSIYADLVAGTEAYGDLFEHFVIKELIYTSRYLQRGYEFSYYRTQDKAEVDLIIETPTKQIIAVEIKSSLSVDSRDLKGLKSFAKVCPKAKLVCVLRGGESVSSANGIEFVPVDQLYNYFFKAV